MVDTGSLLGLGQSLALLTYVLGVLFQTLPIPVKSIRAHGPSLMWDGIVAEFALLSVNIVRLLELWISRIIQQSIGSPFNYQPLAIATILAQLSALDASFLLLISAMSASVILAPVANALSSVLGPALTWTTIAIVIWVITQIAAGLITQIWLSAYILGIVFLAIPFQLGRRFGILLMSSSIILAIGLPLMPSMAIWLEGYLGYQTAILPLQNILSQIATNPLLIGNLLATIPQAIGGILAAVVIALIVFPFAYLFILSLFIRSLANLLGGSSGGPVLTNQIVSVSSGLAGAAAREVQHDA
ncbi:MAG: hypothetical protein HY296_06065 [Thaumarchaeota archaeon]|nr:hypothetical protein [Nitrososphaerota archaeon]